MSDLAGSKRCQNAVDQSARRFGAELDRDAVAPIDLTAKLRCPLLGLFGNDDENPNRDQVNRTEAVLKKLGKTYEFLSLIHI